MANVGIALQFPTPPLDLTHLESLPFNPYSGPLQFLTRQRGPIAVDAYGLYWRMREVPVGIGTSIRTDVFYDRQVAEFREIQEDILSNTEAQFIHPVNRQSGFFMFNEFPILRVGLWVYPHCSVDLSWIVVF